MYQYKTNKEEKKADWERLRFRRVYMSEGEREEERRKIENKWQDTMQINNIKID